jgi:hypothetical protein
VLQQWTGWLRSKKEVLQLHLQLQLVLNFQWDKVKRCQRHCRITLILLIPGTRWFYCRESFLRVLDGLVFLFSAVDGVEPQSETNWDLQINIRYHVLIRE